MSGLPSHGDIAKAVEEASSGRSIDRVVNGDWRLCIERQQPYLCVYRQPADRADPGTEQLLTTQASFLLASGDAIAQKRLRTLTEGICRTLADVFRRALLVEIWTTETAPESPEVGSVAFPIRIFADRQHVPSEVLDELEMSLLAGPWPIGRPDVSVEYVPVVSPPGQRPLVGAKTVDSLSLTVLGIEVPPLFREPGTDAIYTQVLAACRKTLGLTLRRTAYAFSHSAATYRPRHHHELGPQALTEAVLRADAVLSAVGDADDLLLHATPVNTEAAWHEFQRTHFDKAPEFHYRALKASPTLLKRQLFEADLENIEDPALHHLFDEKQRELERRVSMLADRGEPSFLLESQQVFGAPSTDLMRDADRILAETPPRTHDDRATDSLSAAQFAEKANDELSRYKNEDPSLVAQVEIRNDIAGVMVSQGNLLVSDHKSVPRARVEAILQHEIGTHVVTHHNGLQQPLSMFHSGLAGYNDVQEGLAVLAEILCGGLTRPRLRQLAGRVIAVGDLVAGAEFVDVFRRLHDDHGFSQPAAYSITMRVFRGGGFTKDAAYLRGLLDMIDYVAGGGSLEPLLVGKIGLDHIEIVEELWWRQILSRPRLQPFYLQTAAAQERLERLANHRGPAVDFLLENIG